MSCEWPIEEMFLKAAQDCFDFGDPCKGRIFKKCNLSDALQMAAASKDLTIRVHPQVTIDDYRVDFVILYRRDGLKDWHPLIVECDGHEFHERTKQQAQRDKARDRWLQSSGYHVFRFTGSELFRDAESCAMEALSLAHGVQHTAEADISWEIEIARRDLLGDSYLAWAGDGATIKARLACGPQLLGEAS